MEGDRAREAWAALRDLAHDDECMQRVHRVVAEAGLTPGLAKVLGHMPVGGDAIPMRELAAGLRCDSSYVTSVVDALEEHGLAHREAHPTDRRVKVVRFTPAGELLARRVQAELASPPPCFDALSSDEVEELRQLLDKLQQGRRLESASGARSSTRA